MLTCTPFVRGFLLTMSSFIGAVWSQTDPHLHLGQVYDVSKYGAKGDGKTKDTEAVRKAFSDCAQAGGGTVLFPNLHSLQEHGHLEPPRHQHQTYADHGFWAPNQVRLRPPSVQDGNSTVYLTGSFNISSNTVVQIDEGVTVLASNGSEDFPLIEPQPWNGGGSDYLESGALMYQPFIHSFHADNIRITGGGTVDGNGEAWWKCWRGDPKSPPCNGISRPHLINLVTGNNIEVDHINIHNSPSWTLHFSNLTGVHAHDLVVINPASAPNADGIDVDCSQQVVVENCRLDVGDDVTAVKSGIDWLGRQYGRPSRDVLIRNLQGFHGHGLAIGSDMSAGVHNVTFYNITLDGTDRGVRLKSQRGRGGEVSNITYRQLTMKNVGTAISMNLEYHKGLKPTNATATPRFDGITVIDVTAVGSEIGYLFDGLEESHIQGIVLQSVNISAKHLFGTCEFVSGTCSSDMDHCPPCFT